MNEDAFNMSIRKFLKTVGVHSQREIEAAVERAVSAGKLKGNKGNQNYPLPAGTDLAGYTSVSLWCERFDVSFGAAELTVRNTAG